MAEAFRTGGGVPYAAFRPGFTDVMDAANRNAFDEHLVAGVLPLVPGLVDRLRTGARVADLGCGTGHAVVLLAQALPASTFVGYDLSEEALDRGRKEAAERGVANAVFERRDIVELQPPEPLDAVVDVAGLPGWDLHIARVLDAPADGLAVGDEWVVQIRAMGTTWPSRARMLVLDRAARRFERLSRSDDGNPSWVEWRWQVDPLADGRSRLAVTWEGNPLMFWRRLLLARIRSPRLAEEVRQSLTALARELARAPSA